MDETETEDCGLKWTNTLSIHYSVVAKTLKYTQNFGKIIGKIVAVDGRDILWFS